MKKNLIVLIILFSAVIFYGWEKTTKIAVLDLETRVKNAAVDRSTITELLQTELVKQNAFIVVERAYLSKILEEQKLQLSGVTENDAVKIGTLAGAKKIITGSLSEIAGKYVLLVKVIDTESGAIEIMEDENGYSIDDIVRLMPNIAFKIAQKSKSGDTLPPLLSQQKQELPVPAVQNDEQKTVNSQSTQKNEKTFGGWFPVQLAFVTGVQLVPQDFLITGYAFNIISGYNEGVWGLQQGFINDAGEILGSQQGFINTTRTRVVGGQLGFINTAKGDMAGCQAGFINNADVVYGLQMGFINSTRILHGVQLGFINTVKEGKIGFMPILNIGF